MNKNIKSLYIAALKDEMKYFLSKITSTENSILELTAEDKIDMTEMEVLTKCKRAYVHARFELEKIVLSLKK